MQGYQVHATALAGCRLIAPQTIHRTRGLSWTMYEMDGSSFAVPSSPGHARHLRPYPPSRRRRQ